MFNAGYYLTSTNNLRLFLTYGMILDHQILPKYYNDIQSIGNEIPLAKTEEEIQIQLHAVKDESSDLPICLIRKKGGQPSSRTLKTPCSLSKIEVYFPTSEALKNFNEGIKPYKDICTTDVVLKVLSARQRNLIGRIERNINKKTLIPEDESCYKTTNITSEYTSLNDLDTYKKILRAGSLLSIVYSLSFYGKKFSDFFLYISGETKLDTILNFNVIIDHIVSSNFILSDKDKTQLETVILKLFNTVLKNQNPCRDTIAEFLATKENFVNESWSNKALMILNKIKDLNESSTKLELLNTDRSIFQTLCYILINKKSWNDLKDDNTLISDLSQIDLLLAGIFFGIFSGYNNVSCKLRSIKNLNLYISDKMCTLSGVHEDLKPLQPPKTIYNLIIPKTNAEKLYRLESNLYSIGLVSEQVDHIIEHTYNTEGGTMLKGSKIKNRGIPKIKLLVHEDRYYNTLIQFDIDPITINRIRK